MSIGPQVPFSEELHADKYRGPNENFREAMSRVASGLTHNNTHFHRFRDILLEMRFMPAGRIQSAIGSTRQVTPYNCFVSGTIEDSMVAGNGCIIDRFKEAMTTMRMGGGIGYDFSTLRPRGAMIKKLSSKSSGPISFMQIFNAGCQAIASAGHRRGAQMGVLRIDHPDVEEFVHAKQNEKAFKGFNFSLAITDEFMRAVQMGFDRFDLRWKGEVYRTINPQDLWNTIMRSTWDWAEPGVLFIDRINNQNNLQYCETIAATNPCAEQPLPPYGACLLGSFNLAKYLRKIDGTYKFDMAKFQADIPVVVEAMDNVVDEAAYPLYEQEQEAKNKRRMGLGITGLANCLEAQGMEYGSSAFLEAEDHILETMAKGCYRTSIKLAMDKGSFPLLDREKYVSSPFIKSLGHEIQEGIMEHGIRNSHLMSIAPTGTISLCADNVSSGIEPVFDYSFDRTVIEFNSPRKETVHDYGYKVLGVKGKRCADVTPQEHLAVLKVAYRWVDSAVSKTCNVPSSTPWEAFKQIYMDAWLGGCKGCTTYQVGGKRGGILEVKADEEDGADTIERVQEEEQEAMACKYDPDTGRKSCD